MNSAIHFSFLRGRQGEIDALAGLSPYAQARINPVVDLPVAVLGVGESLEEYVGQFVKQLTSAWGVRDSLYVDLTRYGPDLSAPATLQREIESALSSLSLPPEEVDVLLDAESLVLMAPAESSEPVLIATLREALSVLQKSRFRCVVFAASSVPENLIAQPNDEPLIFERKELRIWKELTRSVVDPLIRFGDYAIWHPRQEDAGSGGIAPARIRVPLGERQVYFRSAATDYRALCRRVERYPGVAALPRSRGLNAVRECAAGYGPSGNATSWVARDTNIHIEATVREVEEHLSRIGRLREIELSSSHSTPWLQESLVPTLEGKA